MHIKSVKMKILNFCFLVVFFISQGSLNPKIRFLGQKMCSVARLRTDGHTHTKVTTVGTLSGFQDFFNLSSRIGPIELKVFICVSRIVTLVIQIISDINLQKHKY